MDQETACLMVIEPVWGVQTTFCVLRNKRKLNVGALQRSVVQDLHRNLQEAL